MKRLIVATALVLALAMTQPPAAMAGPCDNGDVARSASPTCHPRWKSVPTISVLSAEGDPRLPLVRAAATFWNNTLSALGIGFRLGRVTELVGTIPLEDLKELQANFIGTGRTVGELPDSIKQVEGNIVVVLSDGDFVSFAGRGTHGDKAVVAIKDHRSFPLTLPNVARNVIAHELGHVLGLSHNADPLTLMCGRPAPCRPDAFASDVDRYFPLTAADKANLRRAYALIYPVF
jgi:hypothetical protein